MAAPNSAERKACWDARDHMWKCLDDNNDEAASCENLQKELEAKCPAQWVSYLEIIDSVLAFQGDINCAQAV